MIRQLTTADTDLLRQAFDWRLGTPAWFRAMLNEGGPEQTWEDYLEASGQMVEFGVFEDEMYGLISVAPAGAGRFAAHISARRGSDPEKLALAAFTVRDWLFKQGAREIFAWVASKHLALKKLCRLAGMAPDTVTMIRGEVRGKLILWERYSCRA